MSKHPTLLAAFIGRLTRMVVAAALPAFILVQPAFAQTDDHVKAVKKAERSAYAIGDSTNQCPIEQADLLGWPANRLRFCEYKQGRLKGAVHLLIIPSEKTAQWIETACNVRMQGQPRCFDVVLACGRFNSGMMFPVSGNIIEDDKNFFFRNGMTVKIAGFPHAGTDPIDLAIQRAIALKPDSDIQRIPSGLARFWRTRPAHLAAISSAGTVPERVDSADLAAKWLGIVKAEMLTALDGPANRLLDAYVQAHLPALRALLGKAHVGPNDCPN